MRALHRLPVPCGFAVTSWGVCALLLTLLLRSAHAAGALPPDARPESLQALLARVLDQDPGVRVGEAMLGVMQQRRLQARSRLGPSAGVTVTRGHAEQLEFNQPIDRDTRRTDAALRWNLYNQGNDRAELLAVTHDMNAAREDMRRAREDAAERIGEAYAEMLRWQSLLPRSAGRVTAVQRMAQLVERQNRQGKLSDADAQQAQATLLDAEISHEMVIADHASARDRLLVLTGGQVREALPIELPEAPGSLLRAVNGEVLATQKRAQAAQQRVRPRLSLLAPRVDLEYRYNLSNRTDPPNVATTEEEQGWTVTARWDLPLLGEAQARRNEAARRAVANAAEAQRVARAAETELAMLPPRIAQARRAIAQLTRQIEQYDALIRAGELQFEAGRRTLAQLAQLHASRYAAEERRAEQEYRLVSSRLRQLSLSGELLPALGLSLY